MRASWSGCCPAARLVLSRSHLPICTWWERPRLGGVRVTTNRHVAEDPRSIAAPEPALCARDRCRRDARGQRRPGRGGGALSRMVDALEHGARRRHVGGQVGEAAGAARPPHREVPRRVPRGEASGDPPTAACRGVLRSRRPAAAALAQHRRRRSVPRRIGGRRGGRLEQTARSSASWRSRVRGRPARDLDGRWPPSCPSPAMIRGRRRPVSRVANAGAVVRRRTSPARTNAGHADDDVRQTRGAAATSPSHRVPRSRSADLAGSTQSRELPMRSA